MRSISIHPLRYCLVSWCLPKKNSKWLRASKDAETGRLALSLKERKIERKKITGNNLCGDGGTERSKIPSHGDHVMFMFVSLISGQSLPIMCWVLVLFRPNWFSYKRHKSPKIFSSILTQNLGFSRQIIQSFMALPFLPCTLVLLQSKSTSKVFLSIHLYCVMLPYFCGQHA